MIVPAFAVMGLLALFQRRPEPVEAEVDYTLGGMDVDMDILYDECYGNVARCVCGQIEICESELVNHPEPCPNCGTYPSTDPLIEVEEDLDDVVAIEARVTISNFHNWDWFERGFETRRKTFLPNNRQDVMLFGMALQQALDRGTWNGKKFDDGGWEEMNLAIFQMLGDSPLTAYSRVCAGELPC